jgi:sulfur carrier protein ThiS
MDHQEETKEGKTMSHKEQAAAHDRAMVVLRLMQRAIIAGELTVYHNGKPVPKDYWEDHSVQHCLEDPEYSMSQREVEQWIKDHPEHSHEANP